MRTLSTLTPALLALAALAPAPARAEPSKEEMVTMLKGIDDRIRSTGDYKALVYIEQKERDKADIVHEALVYRRDLDQKLMILFVKPKAEAGTGYLRLDKNFWFYDPNVGKWERRTDRERIAGTDSRRQDFDQSKLAEEYEPVFEKEEKLGAFETVLLKLTVKPDTDVAYPVVRLWIDKATGNYLKRQDYALSGRLMRTSYVPKWAKQYSESKKADVWFNQEIRIYDEVDKANATLVIIKTLELKPLEANMFTKAWLESKSR